MKYASSIARRAIRTSALRLYSCNRIRRQPAKSVPKPNSSPFTASSFSLKISHWSTMPTRCQSVDRQPTLQLVLPTRKPKMEVPAPLPLTWSEYCSIPMEASAISSSMALLRLTCIERIRQGWWLRGTSDISADSMSTWMRSLRNVKCQLSKVRLWMEYLQFQHRARRPSVRISRIRRPRC